jgi:hypothetical protein
MAVGTLSIEAVKDLFGIEFDICRIDNEPWRLAHEPHKVPDILSE